MTTKSRNKLIVENYDKRKELNNELGFLFKQREKLDAEYAKMEELVDDLFDTDEIYRGVALRIKSGNTIDVMAVDHDINRWSHIYPFAHTNPKGIWNGSWVCRINRYPSPGSSTIDFEVGSGGKCFGLGPDENNPRKLTKPEAVKMGKDWVATGRMPKEKDERRS